jgi:integrase
MRIVWFRGAWYAYERDGGRSKRTSLGAKDRAVAEKRLIDLQQARRRKATTVAEMYADYLRDRAPQLRSRETFDFAWRRLKPVFGHLRPDQVTRVLTRAYANKETRRGVGSASIRRDLGVLSAILRYNNKNSPAVIEMPATPPPRSRHLSREQFRALLEAAGRTPHLFLFVLLAYRMAGRASAIVELTWDRIDFARSRICLAADGAGEGAKRRATVPMTEETATVLRQARAAAVTDYVIEYGGKPVRSVKKAFGRAAGRAGLPPGTSPHVLRHSAAVHMAEGGVPMAEISQYLGHSSTAITERVYARFSPGYLRWTPIVRQPEPLLKV